VITEQNPDPLRHPMMVSRQAATENCLAFHVRHSEVSVDTNRVRAHFTA